ncbi:MAG: phosphoribosylamine--glycine ligase [Bdellovibrionales bacterium]|nr:phosphoribosylamine--glycine ligase [Bdellovibrionales bacterium]
MKTTAAKNPSVTELPLLKRGSVKNLRGPLPESGGREIVFEFTDDFSVFDWGKMPDPIPGKGRALLGLASHVFRELGHPASWKGFFKSTDAEKFLAIVPEKYRETLPELRRELESVGMRSCFRGVYVGPTGPEALIVEKLEILPPTEVREGTVIRYDYANVAASTPGALIPLEVVFRHALTDKSSFFERNPDTQLKPGHAFTTPLVEFFTKLEPTDRFIGTDAEARMVGRTDDRTLRELELRTILLSLWLRRECAMRELELIDGKFEWGLDREGRVTLADAIGPDELRLVERRRGFNLDARELATLAAGGTVKPPRLSKEFLREYYRDGEWFAELTAMKKAGDLPPGWQKTVRAEVPRLPREALERATALYRALERRFRPETVLLLGSGAREHAIARRLMDSPNLRTLVWAPGQDAAVASLESQLRTGLFPNSATKRIVRWSDATYSRESSETLVRRAREAGVTLVVVSQDADLEAGAADAFRAAGFAVFGPSREAARIEWSKTFTKELCAAAGVPTARAFTADSVEAAKKQIESLAWTDSEKYVVKADGLALGKGVVVAETKADALAGLNELARFGNRFVIESRLHGEESSWFAFADGETFSLLDPAKDYKRLGDGQTGPNTGGMGAVSPAPETTPALRERVRKEIFAPIFAELKKRGIRYQGLLYAGLMIDGAELALLEFNARFGDPETQALLPRMESDLLEWFGASAEGTLVDYPRDVPFREGSAVYVVAASAGYPESPRTGTAVPLTESTLAKDHFRYAGLRADKNQWFVSGGRVLGALGFGGTVDQARTDAYAKLEEALFDGAQIRRDIGR